MADTVKENGQLCFITDKVIYDSPTQQKRSFDCFLIDIEKQNPVQTIIYSSNWCYEMFH